MCFRERDFESYQVTEDDRCLLNYLHCGQLILEYRS